MSQPFVGEIRMFGGTFAPAGWALCDGRTLAISEYETLFTLIGTIYGGDGQSTFNVPDLRGRVPLHFGTAQTGTTYVQGQLAGTEAVTLTNNQMPAHTHPMRATSSGQVASPQGAYYAVATSTQGGVVTYGTPPITTALAPGSVVAPVGGSQPHTNVQPTLFVNYIISLFGIFPSRN